MKTQSERLLADYKRGWKISTFKAFLRYGITSLHRRNSDLRKLGHPIDYGVWVEKGRNSYKEYSMGTAALRQRRSRLLL